MSMRDTARRLARNLSRPVSIIFGVALLVRLLAVFFLPNDVLAQQTYQPYDEIAQNIVNGNGFSYSDSANPERVRGVSQKAYELAFTVDEITSDQPPVYPFLLAGIYWLFHGSLLAVGVVQAIIGALSCLLIYPWAKRLFGTDTGQLESGIAAIYPPFIFHEPFGQSNYLHPETTFIFLLCLALVILSRHGTVWRDGLVGLVLGTALLTKTLAILFPLLLSVWYVTVFGLKAGCKKYAAMIVVLVLMLVLWTVRHYAVHGEFVLIQTSAGRVFWHGNNVLARGGPTDLSGLPDFDPARYSEMREAEIMREMYGHGLEFWFNHPERLPKLFIRKLLMFWNVYGEGYNPWYGFILPVAMYGKVVATRQGLSGSAPMLLLIASFCIAVVINSGTIRYRYPIEPFLVLLASLGIWHLFRLHDRRVTAFGVMVVIGGVNAVGWLWSDSLLSWLRDGMQAVGMR